MANRNETNLVEREQRMKMTKENREHLQQNLIVMGDSYPEKLIDELCQVVVDFVEPAKTPEDIVTETEIKTLAELI